MMSSISKFLEFTPRNVVDKYTLQQYYYRVVQKQIRLNSSTSKFKNLYCSTEHLEYYTHSALYLF
jgi:hypothetical protein